MTLICDYCATVATYAADGEVLCTAHRNDTDYAYAEHTVKLTPTRIARIENERS